MSWLVEGRVLIYLLLILAAAVCFVLFRQYPGRTLLIAGALLAAAVIYFALDLVVETDAEQIQRKVKAMAAAVEAKKTDQLAEHLAANFYGHSFDKNGFRVFVDRMTKDGQIQSAAAWDFENFAEPDAPALVAMGLKEDEAQALLREHKVLAGSFKGKVKGAYGGDAAFYLIKTVFVREGDSQWRLRTFQVGNPVTNE